MCVPSDLVMTNLGKFTLTTIFLLVRLIPFFRFYSVLAFAVWFLPFFALPRTDAVFWFLPLQTTVLSFFLLLRISIASFYLVFSALLLFLSFSDVYVLWISCSSRSTLLTSTSFRHVSNCVYHSFVSLLSSKSFCYITLAFNFVSFHLTFIFSPYYFICLFCLFFSII